MHETSGFQSTQFKTSVPFSGKASALLPQETCYYLILTCKPISSYSLISCNLLSHRGFPKPGLNELYNWRNEWLYTDSRSRNKRRKVLTEKAYLYVRGSAGLTDKRHHNRDTLTGLYTHTCPHTHSYSQPYLHTHTCTHKKGRNSPLKRQIEWNEYRRTMPSHYRILKKQEQTRALLLKF